MSEIHIDILLIYETKFNDSSLLLWTDTKRHSKKTKMIKGVTTCEGGYPLQDDSCLLYAQY